MNQKNDLLLNNSVCKVPADEAPLGCLGEFERGEESEGHLAGREVVRFRPLMFTKNLVSKFLSDPKREEKSFFAWLEHREHMRTETKVPHFFYTLLP